jgi:hypothetical protein
MSVLRMCLYFESCPKWGRCDLKFEEGWRDCPDRPKEGFLTTRPGKLEDGICKMCEKRPVCKWLQHNTELGLYVVRCRAYREEITPVGASDGIPANP